MQTMKTYIKLWLIGLLALSSYACEDFLELEPKSFISEDNFLNNREELQLALIGVDEGGQQVADQLYMLTEMRSDNSRTFLNEGAIGEVSRFRDGASNGIVSEFWRDSYIAIQRANIVLSRLDVIEDEQIRTQIEAEAKMLRGYFYFNMARLFGDVPLVMEPIEVDNRDAFEKDPQAEVYAAIVDDFTFAAANLPDRSQINSNDLGRATSGAAKGFLAKVLLMQNTDEATRQALTLLEEVLGDGYQLEDDYTQVFPESNEMNDEILFSIRYSGETEASAQNFSVDATAQGLSQGVNAPTPDFITKYSADPRGAFMISEPDDVGRQYNVKFLDDIRSGIDLPVLRYADILLLYAEVLNETGNTAMALTPLNDVRRRAGVSDTTVTDPIVLRQIIMDERRVELAFENQRWFDLLRYHQRGYIDLYTVMNAFLATDEGAFTVSNHQLVFAVPQREIDTSDGALKQTPGY